MGLPVLRSTGRLLMCRLTVLKDGSALRAPRDWIYVIVRPMAG